MINKRAIGDIGENIAVEYLKKKGYKILERNCTSAGVELDIVAKDKNTLVFCEVKTRNDVLFGRPVEAVNRAKQLRYIQGAKGYIVANKIKNTDIRFDVIEVLPDEINHLIGALEC